MQQPQPLVAAAPTRSRWETAPRLELAPLQAFAGRWSTEGHQVDGPLGRAAVIRAVERWDWLPGRDRMAHRFDGRRAGARLAYGEILSAGRQLGCFDVETYGDEGLLGTAQLVVDGDHEWTLRNRDVTADGLIVRCRMVLDRARGVLESHWEWSQNGTEWRIFRELSSVRVEVT